MSNRVRYLAAIVAASVLSAGLIGGAVASDKVPTDEVVTLRLGTTEFQQGPGFDPAIGAFADRVAELSGGGIVVEQLWGLAGHTNDPEQEIIRLVQGGELELGWSGARAFDVLGVQSFQALQAPFLITDYDHLRQVVNSSMPAEMLAGLDAVGLEGLALYPNLLRHPVGYQAPLATLADLQGARIRVPASDASDAIWRALGSEPLHLNGAALEAALADGTLDGIDFPMGAPPPRPGAVVTSNVVLYPRTSVLFLSQDAAAALSEEQLAVLRTAAVDTVEFSLSVLPQADDATRFCEDGGRVVIADQGDVDAMKAAVLPVRSAMEQDPATKAFIDRIEALKGAAPATAPAATCDQGVAPAPTTGPDPFAAGTYTATATRQDALRAGIDDWCALQSDGLHIKVIIGKGRYHLFTHCEGRAEESWDIGSYTATSDTIAMGPDCCPGQTTVFAWTLDGNTLTLTIVDETNSPPGDIPLNHFLYEREWASE